MKILIPTQFQKVIKSSEIERNGKTVEEILTNLLIEFPELEGRLVNQEGKLNKFINIFVNDENINFLNDMKTELKDNDVITILPAIAGG
jgi:molybdopterin synthase sulfur carrier subunit